MFWAFVRNSDRRLFPRRISVSLRGGFTASKDDLRLMVLLIEFKMLRVLELGFRTKLVILRCERRTP